MKHRVKVWLACLALASALPMMAQAASEKPNILFIMGDDIGIMNVGAYHQGLMVGETPNIDRLAQEGARFMTYYAEQSCTAGRTAFFTGMHPLRAGMVMPQLPGATSSLLPGTPALAKFLLDLGYNTGEFGKNHLGDKSASLPTAHGFQEFWGYLYHLDAMQGNRSDHCSSLYEHPGQGPGRGPRRRGSEEGALYDPAASGYPLYVQGRQ
jgi:arylsulfatase